MILNNDFYIVNSLEKDGQKIIGEISIDPRHHIFDGHFPGNPVVPGVCMVEIIKEILGLANEKEYRLSEAGNVKFMNILNPEVNPVVNIEHEIVTETEDTVKLKSTIFNGEKVFLKFSGSFINSSI